MKLSYFQWLKKIRKILWDDCCEPLTFFSEFPYKEAYNDNIEPERAAVMAFDLQYYLISLDCAD